MPMDFALWGSVSCSGSPERSYSSAVDIFWVFVVSGWLQGLGKQNDRENVLGDMR